MGTDNATTYVIPCCDRKYGNVLHNPNTLGFTAAKHRLMRARDMRKLWTRLPPYYNPPH